MTVASSEVLRGHSRSPKKTSVVQMAATSVAISLGSSPKKISERKVQVVAEKMRQFCEVQAADCRGVTAGKRVQCWWIKDDRCSPRAKGVMLCSIL